MLHGGDGLLADANDGHAGIQHKALLAARDRQIDAPFIHPEIHGGQRGHAIYIKQCRMPCRIHGAANSAYVGTDAGRRLVMRDQNRLDFVIVVFGEALAVEVGRCAGTPGAFNDFDVQTVAFA